MKLKNKDIKIRLISLFLVIGFLFSIVRNTQINAETKVKDSKKVTNINITKNLDVSSKNKIIIVGDSRTYNMSKMVEQNSQVVFICKSGKGLEWFKSEGITQVNEIKQPNDIIVLWLGVNDYRSLNLGDISYKAYAKTYNELAIGDWKEQQLYVASVGYVDRERIKIYYNKDNRSNISQIGSTQIKGISDFNKKLKSKLDKNIHWISLDKTIGISKSDKDTKDKLWLKRDNGLYDGLHYGEDVTKKVYKKILYIVNEK